LLRNEVFALQMQRNKKQDVVAGGQPPPYGDRVQRFVWEAFRLPPFFSPKSCIARGIVL
jgi:hypothetical protein